MRSANHVPSLAACTGLAVICAQPCAAQETDADAEIVVTAQRRPEQAQDVPISLTARSGEQLERMQVIEMADLGKTVPSLVMTRTGAFTQPYLRGVGKRSNLGVENGVATYIDGVYLASAISGLLDLRGIERVEVLNGPQGTLFGRNTTGGVIQVVTRDPSPTAASAAEIHAGTYGYLRGDAYLTGGTDALAGNLAVSLSRNGGYGSNLFTGEQDEGEVDHSLVARSKWVWHASELLKVTFAADYQDIEQDFSQRSLEAFPPIGEPRTLAFRDGDQDASNRFHFKYGGVSMTAEADTGGVRLLSISAVRRLHAAWNTDLDFGPLTLLSGHPVTEQRQFSQEFQLQSGEGSPITWLAGLYYIRIEEDLEPLLFRYGGSYAARLGGRIERTLTSAGRVSSYAAYGQGTVPIDADTRLTAGLRYTVEDRSVEAQGQQVFDNAPVVRPIPGLPLPGMAPLADSETFREATWRASLDHDFSDTLLGYLSASRGFQSGGWNLQNPQFAPFAPETLDAFETGLKFAGASGRITADAAVFYYDYSDIQVSAFTATGSMTTNAASAEIYGLDLQLDVRLDSRTGIVAGAQLLEAHYGSFTNATCIDPNPNAPARYAALACDASGNRLPFAPAFKSNLGVSHEVRLGQLGSLLLSGNFAYNSGYFAEADNLARQDAFATLDLSAEWRPAIEGLSVRLWARNVTDARYYDSLTNFPTAGVPQKPAAPQRFGISVTYRFQAL